ncbi:MAG TPA: protein kinase [Armatimonadota bacterium]
MSVNTLGRYKIIREIARSNDVVYEAVDPGINRRVALKELLLPPNLSGVQRRERVERFYREARAAGLLAHPNIVTIFEAGEFNGRHFIAMEYLEGQTLRDLLEIEKVLSPERTTEIAKQILDALAYAHANGVVHRDVKPDNVQILPSGRAKLTDFGIARIMEEPTLTADGQVFGTPSYMSPEQVAGKPIDGRTDLFSLGVMMYEMLTGRKPFSGDSVVTITYNIMNQDVMVPPTVPAYLERVIKRALEKDPEFRYSTAAEMEAAIDPSAVVYAPQKSPPDALNTTIQSPGTWYGPATAPPPPIPQRVGPDPFANLKPGDLSMPRPAARPLLSDETKYFFKVFFGVILVVGLMLLFVSLFFMAYQRSHELSHTDDIRQRINVGLQYYGQESYESAVSQFKLALAMTSDSKLQYEIKHDMAVCYIAMGDRDYSMGRVDSAMTWWQTAESVEPKNSSALDRISTVYLDWGNRAAQSGDTQTALTWWQKSQDAGPGTNAGIQAGRNIQRVTGIAPVSPSDNE